MIKLILNSILCIFFIFCFTGCAGLFVASDSSQNQNMETYREKALAFEKENEWQMALYCWKMADSLSIQGKETAIKVSDLTAHIKQKSEKHFNNGLNLYKNDKSNQARREFYLAVKIDPGNNKAVLYLKNILKGNKYKTSGMNAKDADGDGQRDDKTISLVHSVPASKKSLDSKTVLQKPKIDFEAKLVKGDAFLKAGEYDNAISISEEILKHIPLNKKAFDLANASYYQKGAVLDARKKYLQSLDMFRKVDPEYKDVKQKISRQMKVIKDLANQYYKKGVKFYINENFKKAIMEWRKVLEFNPDHEDAKRDISKAIEILEKLELMQ